MDKQSVGYHTPQRSMLSHLQSNIVPRKFLTRTKRHLQTYRQIMNRIKGHKIQYADEHVPKQVMSNVSIVYRCTQPTYCFNCIIFHCLIIFLRIEVHKVSVCIFVFCSNSVFSTFGYVQYAMQNHQGLMIKGMQLHRLKVQDIALTVDKINC